MKLSVTTKIFLAFAAMIAIFGLASVYNVSKMQTLRENTAFIRNGLLPTSLEVGTLTRNVKNLETLLSRSGLRSAPFPRDYLYAANPFLALNNAVRRLKRRRGLNELVQRHRTLLFALIARLERHSAKDRSFQKLVDRYVTAGERKKSIEANRALREIRGELRKLRLDLRKINRAVLSQLSKSNQLAADEEWNSILAMVIVSFLGLVAGILILLVSQYTLRPLKVLRSGVKEISRGDFTQRVQIDTGDEIGQLADEFNSMAHSLLQRDHELAARRNELQGAYDEVTALQTYNENIIHSIPSAILVADKSLCVTSVNRPATRLLARSESELLQQNVKQLAILGDLEQLDRFLEQVLNGESSERLFAAVPILRDGAEILVDWQVQPFVEEEQILGLVLIGEDVTEKLATEARLLQNERLAAIGKLMSQITHEIRNPLSSIGLNAELMEEEIAGLDGDKSEPLALLKSIAAEIDRLTAVTETYLRFGRPPKPDLHDVDLNKSLDGLLFFLKEEIAANQIECRKRFEPLPALQLDENQLKQALLNLIRNAMESMQPSGTLSISTSRNGDSVQIAISDSGGGISAPDLQKIFDPFYSTKDSGTGLGLALTRQIVEEHGGTLNCDSQLGRGTTFTIRLPLRESPSESSPG